MKASRRGIPLAVLLSALGDAGHTQGQDHAPCESSMSSWCGLSEGQAEFLRRGRIATEAYRRLAAAVADGFRPMGADAPAMGRHWVSFERLFDGEIDAERPEILMYAMVDGRESLVGIGFGYVAGAGEDSAPPANPFHPDAWHRHSGRLDMESHRMDHIGPGLGGAGPAAREGEAGAGVSVLHAWVWVENPAGVLEPNNWALPYSRLALSRPESTTPEADRALSLASGGADFLIARAEFFTDPGSGLTGDRAEVLRQAETLRQAEAEVSAWWRARLYGPLTPSEVEWLGEVWRGLGPKSVP